MITSPMIYEKYKVTLTNEERETLNTILKKGRVAARKRIHAHILLRADESGTQGAWTDARIVEAYDVDARTVERLRERFVEHGFRRRLATARSSRKQGA